MTAPVRLSALESRPRAVVDLFPAFGRVEAAWVDLDARSRRARLRDGASRFLQADVMDRYLRRLNHVWGAPFTLGGYLEDRGRLWQGSYLAPDRAVHLAIDVNVPAGLEVAVTRPCRIAAIAHDPDQQGGWGSVVMCALDRPEGAITHFLYAHLSRASVTVNVGDAVHAGGVVGRIGKSTENGGWYEHLHIQAFTQAMWDKGAGNLANFDGYGAPGEAAAHPDFPDPAPLLSRR